MTLQQHSNPEETNQTVPAISGNKPGYEYRPFSPENIKPRKAYFDFSDDIPKLWLDGESYAYTHLMNSFNLFSPDFEAMIARTTRAYIDKIQDRDLKHQARGFIGQETIHGQTHAKFLDLLRAQGYKIDGFVKFSQWFFTVFMEQWMGSKICLAATAGFEHYADIVIVVALGSDFLKNAEPRVKEFYQWHAAEEAEHNAVAHEVLCQVDDSYLLRFLGNIIGVSTIFGFVLSGALYLLAQDRQLFRLKTWKDIFKFFFNREYGLARLSLARFFQYMHPKHHPNDDPSYPYLASLARNFLNS